MLRNLDHVRALREIPNADASINRPHKQTLPVLIEGKSRNGRSMLERFPQDLTIARIESSDETILRTQGEFASVGPKMKGVYINPPGR